MAHIYGNSSFNDHYNIESKVMQVLDSPSSTSELTYRHSKEERIQ